MLRFSKLLFIGVLLILMLGAQAAWAKGEPQQITLSGPGIIGELTLTAQKPGEFAALGMATLEDVQRGPVEAPTNAGIGYEMTRSFQDGKRYVPFDRVRYYPGPEGERSYVYVVGIVNGSSEYDGKWFYATLRGNAALRALLAEHVTPYFPAPERFANCPVTLPTEERPAEPNIASWSRLWYRSADGELWADAGRRYAGGVKVGWRKPSGTTLTVTGRHLEMKAQTLTATIPEGYGGAFQASGLTFPVEGCWEIEARAGDSVLTMVNYVYPQIFSPLEGTMCEDLTRMVDESAFVIVGHVQDSALLDGGDFLMQMVQADQILKGSIERGAEVKVLRDAIYRAPLVEGSSYLLFLGAQPNGPYQITCPLVEIDGTKILTEVEWGPLRNGQRVTEVLKQIESIQTASAD